MLELALVLAEDLELVDSESEAAGVLALDALAVEASVICFSWASLWRRSALDPSVSPVCAGFFLLLECLLGGVGL